MNLNKKVLLNTMLFIFAFSTVGYNPFLLIASSHVPLMNLDYTYKTASYSNMYGKTPLIFKLDDFKVSNPNSNFISVLNVFSQKSVSASIGLILDSSDNLTTFKYLKNLDELNFDFFFHGITHFLNSSSAEFETDYYSQLKEFQYAKDIARDFGFDLFIFGAPGNRYNSDTKIALQDTSFKGMFVKEQDSINNRFVEMKIDFSDLEQGFLDKTLNGSYLYERWITPFKGSNSPIVIQLHPSSWDNKNQQALADFLELVKNDEDILSMRAIEYVQNQLTKGDLKVTVETDKYIIDTSNISDVCYYLFEENKGVQWEIIDNSTGISLRRFESPELIPLSPGYIYIIRIFSYPITIKTEIEYFDNYSIGIQWNYTQPVNESQLLILNEKNHIVYYTLLNANVNNIHILLNNEIKLMSVVFIVRINDSYCIKFTNNWIFPSVLQTVNTTQSDTNELSSFQFSIPKFVYRIVIIIQFAINVGCITYILIKRKK